MDLYHDKVIRLLKTDITYELFGFTYKDLMNLDLPTFNKISKVIEELVEERQRQREEIERDEERNRLEEERKNRSLK